ncbi:MAG: c-type cytochrome [Ramlibacter sp.]
MNTESAALGFGAALRRFGKAGAIGLVLAVAAGALGYSSGFQRLAAAVGIDVPLPRAPGAEVARGSREAMVAARDAWLKDVKAPAPHVPVGADGYFAPPSDDELPEGPFGEAIRRGREIFLDTPKFAAQYSGNSQSCVNCHLDAGRKPHSAPLWGAYTQYPMYRGKNKKVNTFQDRIRGCFTYSMNAQASPRGGPPPLGDQVYLDLEAYAFWLASGAPTGQKLPGAGYPKMARTELGYDYDRGAKVYAQNCVLCHGADGQGRRAADGRSRFPPLWGPQAYNWGAGMSNIKNAAGFIKHNMPLGQGGTLSDQDAWDVAAYINSFERPKDPRQTGSIEEARQKFHKDEPSYYGKEVRGRLLGQGISREQAAIAAQ